MKIDFLDLSFKNFMSYGANTTKFDFVGSHLNLVFGGNGDGKSTILDALTFALFGRAYRKVTKAQLINTKNGNKCLVELNFKRGNSNYKIRRGMKPTIFEVYKNGSLIDQEANGRDYQKDLEEILGFNEHVFRQVVCIGISNYRPFLQLSTQQRRTVVENLFEISIFSQMKDELRLYIQHLRDKKQKVLNGQEVTREKMRIRKETIARQQEDLHEQAGKLNEIIEGCEATRKRRTSELHKLTKFCNKMFATLDKDRSVNEKRIHELQGEQSNRNKEIKRLRASAEKLSNLDICPTCHQKVADECKHDFNKQTDERIERLHNQINNIERLLVFSVQVSNGLDIKIANRKKVHKKMEEIKADIRDVKIKAAYAREHLDELNRQSQQVESQVHEDLQKEWKALKGQHAQIRKAEGILDTIKMTISDSGIKKFIIRQFIPTLNKAINYYLNIMDLPLDFHFDDEFNISVGAAGYQEHTYHSFSAGERLRIDFAVLFGFLLILKRRTAVDTNILFLDEIMDSSFDSEGIDHLYNCLESLNQNVFIISHRELSFDRFNRVFKAKKKGRFSSLEMVE